MYKLTIALSLGVLLPVPSALSETRDQDDERGTLIKFILDKSEVQEHVARLKKSDIGGVRAEMNQYFNTARAVCKAHAQIANVFVGLPAKVDRLAEKYLGETIACQQALMRLAAARFVMMLKSRLNVEAPKGEVLRASIEDLAIEKQVH